MSSIIVLDSSDEDETPPKKRSLGSPFGQAVSNAKKKAKSFKDRSLFGDYRLVNLGKMDPLPTLDLTNSAFLSNAIKGKRTATQMACDALAMRNQSQTHLTKTDLMTAASVWNDQSKSRPTLSPKLHLPVISSVQSVIAGDKPPLQLLGNSSLTNSTASISCTTTTTQYTTGPSLSYKAPTTHNNSISPGVDTNKINNHKLNNKITNNSAISDKSAMEENAKTKSPILAPNNNNCSSSNKNNNSGLILPKGSDNSCFIKDAAGSGLTSATSSMPATEMQAKTADPLSLEKKTRRIMPTTLLKKDDAAWLQRQREVLSPSSAISSSSSTATTATAKKEDRNGIASESVLPDAVPASPKPADEDSVESAAKSERLPLVPEYEELLKACRIADSTADMNKLIETKLLKYYYSVHPSFVKSRGFAKNLRAVTKTIKEDPDLVYYNLKTIIDELKARRKDKNAAADDESPSTSSANKHTVEQIKKLNNALHILTKRIQILEESEVDWDDDDSTYLQMERFKKRACKIHEKICDLTGESKNASRLVRKPIQFNGTDYPKFNKTLQAYINRTKEFPDYHDVLRMLEYCNNNYNLGLATYETKRTAHDAFVKVGKLLQNRRKTDLYETVTHFTGCAKDPATSDPELAAKLSENQHCQKKISEVIDKYAREQDLSAEEHKEARQKEKLRLMHGVEEENNKTKEKEDENKNPNDNDNSSADESDEEEDDDDDDEDDMDADRLMEHVESLANGYVSDAESDSHELAETINNIANHTTTVALNTSNNESKSLKLSIQVLDENSGGKQPVQIKCTQSKFIVRSKPKTKRKQLSLSSPSSPSSSSSSSSTSSSSTSATASPTSTSTPAIKAKAAKKRSQTVVAEIVISDESSS